MRTMETDVVVIGGGSTGAGVVRDVAMRGFRAILLDRADMAQSDGYRSVSCRDQPRTQPQR